MPRFSICIARICFTGFVLRLAKYYKGFPTVFRQRKLTEKPSPGKYTFVFSNFLAEESREQRVHWPHAPIVHLLIIICIRQAHTSSQQHLRHSKSPADAAYKALPEAQGLQEFPQTCRGSTSSQWWCRTPRAEPLVSVLAEQLSRR